MLHQALGIPVMQPEAITDKALAELDYLVLGSPVYAGNLPLRKWIWHNRHILETKQLFYFIVCATPAADKEKTTSILSGNIPGVLQTGNPVFFLGGRIVRKELSWLDRLALRMVASASKDPVEKKAMLEGIDRMSSQQLNPLIHAIELYANTHGVNSESLTI
jgi:menaquinone-dependent protoporphyrinogen IX oxidase